MISGLLALNLPVILTPSLWSLTTPTSWNPYSNFVAKNNFSMFFVPTRTGCPENRSTRTAFGWLLVQPSWNGLQPERLDFLAVIKSAASPPRRPQSRNPGESSGPPPSACRAVGRWLPWIPGFGLHGGCASSRLDHGFQIPLRTHDRHPLSGSCSIEKVSSRIANRYTRILDAG